MKTGYPFLTTVMILIMTISISGCGNSSAKRDAAATVAQHMTPDSFPPVMHIGKYSKTADQNDFNLSAIEWEYDNHEGLKIHIDDSDLYLHFTYDKEVSNIQFFIDTDNNAKTGNLDEGGAEYMIENGYLYKSIDPKEWKWQEISKLKQTGNLGVWESVMIKRSDLENLSAIFAINAQALDDKWHPISMSPIDGSKSIYSEKNAIDWSSIKPYTTNEDRVVKVFNTDKMIYIRLEQKSFARHIQIYIDSDNDPTTGYKSSSWKNFGRDYLIEDGNLYRYTGNGNWGWERVSFVERIRDKENKNILEVAVPITSFSSLAQNISIGVETNDKDWMNTVFIPDNDIPLYPLEKPSNDLNIRINEVMAANTNTILDPDYNNFSDWIELYNPNNQKIDISGYYLSDKLNKPKWKFPSNTTIEPHGYLLVWADEKDKNKNALHTNFKLKQKGEAAALFDRDKKLIDGFEYLRQTPDISVTFDGSKTLFMNPTPQKANSTMRNSAILTQKPTFSLKEGFYNQPQTLTISSTPQSEIYYTTDGSIPTTSSNRYEKSLVVDKSIVVRAISVQSGKFASKPLTKSYIYDENITLPVISIAMDDKYLNDDSIGIYTIAKGKKLNDCGDDRPIFVQKWERPAHITLFENNNKVVLSQDAGIRLSGECSRVYAQKSFLLKADDKYGKDSFSYALFKDKPIKKYEKIKLRNAGQDFIKTHIRDALAQSIVKDDLNVLYEAYRPAIVFINGDFWGIYNLREKIGKSYFKENFGEKKIDLLTDDSVVKEGSSKDFDELIDYLQNNSLDLNENYDYVASKIDIDNYIDYQIANIYAANSDWPGTNLVYYKQKKESKKWKWILHDMDFSFSRYSERGVDYDALEAAMASDGPDWPNPQWSTLLFRKLLENQGFKEKFKNRFISKLDTTFAPSRVKDIIDSLTSDIAPYIQRHIIKWQKDGKYSYAVNSKEDWQKEVDKLKDFADKRVDFVKTHIDLHLK